MLLADTASIGEAGKLNLLGVGIRKLQPLKLPATVPVTLAGTVEATAEEAGTKSTLELIFVDHDGSEISVASSEAELPAKTDDPALPVNFVFALTFVRTYTEPGRYALRARFGDLEEEYVFVVAPKRKKRAPKPKAK